MSIETGEVKIYKHDKQSGNRNNRLMAVVTHPETSEKIDLGYPENLINRIQRLRVDNIGAFAVLLVPGTITGVEGINKLLALAGINQGLIDLPPGVAPSAELITGVGVATYATRRFIRAWKLHNKISQKAGEIFTKASVNISNFNSTLPT